MKRAEVLKLLDEFKARIDKTDCGAILIIAASPRGLTDVDVSSNLSQDSQEKIFQALVAKWRARS